MWLFQALPLLERTPWPGKWRNSNGYWKHETRKPAGDVAGVLKEFEGYPVVRLLECDGVPKYSQGGLYEGADETSFHGALLNDCRDVLQRLVERGMEPKISGEGGRVWENTAAAVKAAEAAGGAPRPGCSLGRARPPHSRLVLMEGVRLEGCFQR